MTSVLVTGCSTGIGLETALAFARRGDRVHAGLRNPAGARDLLARADAEGLTLHVTELAATDNPGTALHTPVGKDAEAALRFLAGVTYEQWLPRFLEQAESLVGPRPSPA
ncbi:SDR family NAD(P)-dependent oxidoreductase [Streptomyces sp. NPDC088387]|uniref:SDR family NAD(P)-dependent oxidoreductase n=1 Tax=Streptomyces sp. NPDC088387 TaxID=3365859 RepID=UPI00381AD203